MGPILNPKSVLKTRVILRGNTQIQQALILWDDDDYAAPTWEDVEEFKAHYPLFNLEDKIPFKGDGNVMGVTTGQADSARVNEVANENTHKVGVRRGERVREVSTRLGGYSLK